MTEIDRTLRIKLLCDFKNLSELKGLEVFLSKFFREEILLFVGTQFRELKEILDFVFSTDFGYWNKIVNEQIKKKEELELITQALGDEAEVLRKKIRVLNEKNTEFIDQNALNKSLEAEVERLNNLNSTMNKQYLDLENMKLTMEE